MLALSERTETLARRLAATQKLSIDDTVRRALEQQANSAGLSAGFEDGHVPEEEVARRRALIRDIQRQFAELPILDNRPIQQIVDEINDL